MNHILLLIHTNDQTIYFSTVDFETENLTINSKIAIPMSKYFQGFIELKLIDTELSSEYFVRVTADGGQSPKSTRWNDTKPPTIGLSFIVDRHHLLCRNGCQIFISRAFLAFLSSSFRPKHGMTLRYLHKASLLSTPFRKGQVQRIPSRLRKSLGRLQQRHEKCCALRIDCGQGSWKLDKAVTFSATSW